MRLFGIFFLALLCVCNPSPSPSPTPADAADATDTVATTWQDPMVALRGRLMKPQPPQPPDLRTPEQLADSACAGHCPARKPKLAAGPQPFIPFAWTIPAWFVDPSNSATCAADTNSGTAATCTGGCSGAVCTSGIGPLRTFAELRVHRWGCIGSETGCPRLRQNTTITALSSHVDNTDPVYLRPTIENGALFTLTGPALSTLSTGVLAAVVPKNRPTNTFPFQATFNASAAVNGFWSATHAGIAGFGWMNTGLGANVFTTTQPITSITTLAQGVAANEVDTLANGDTFTLYNAMPSVNLVDFEPIFADNNGTTDNYAKVLHVTIFDPNGVAFDPVFFGDHTTLIESIVQRTVETHSSAVGTEDGSAFAVYNTLWLGGFLTGANPYTTTGVFGGTINSGGKLGGPSAFFCIGNGFVLNLDPIVQGSAGTAPVTSAFAGLGVFNGGMFIPAGTTVNVSRSGQGQTAPIYGAGTLILTQTGRFSYNTGTGNAVLEFPLSGGLRINGQTKACVGIPANATAFSTCNIVVTAATLDANLGALSGCLATPGGGSFCNYGP